MDVSIAIEDAPDQAMQDALADGLRRHDAPFLGAPAGEPLWVVARDGDGVVKGALRGLPMWTWLYIDALWVAEAARGHGLGAALLARAEAAAVARGCHSAFLNSFGFQAPGFYERHGYRRFGELDGFPGGHSLVYLRKRLAD